MTHHHPVFAMTHAQLVSRAGPKYADANIAHLRMVAARGMSSKAGLPDPYFHVHNFANPGSFAAAMARFESTSAPVSRAHAPIVSVGRFAPKPRATVSRVDAIIAKANADVRLRNRLDAVEAKLAAPMATSKTAPKATRNAPPNAPAYLSPLGAKMAAHMGLNPPTGVTHTSTEVTFNVHRGPSKPSAEPAPRSYLSPLGPRMAAFMGIAPPPKPVEHRDGAVHFSAGGLAAAHERRRRERRNT